MLIHLIDANRVFIGTQEILDLFAALPPGALSPPPDTLGAEVAFWTGTEWVVLSGYPEPAPATQG